MNSYEEGVRDTLEELAELFEGVKDVALWREYMGGSND